MEAVRSRPPSPVSPSPDHAVASSWPSVPQNAPQSTAPQSDVKLPDIKTVLSSDFERRPSSPSNHPGSPTSTTRSLPRMDPGYTTQNGRAADMSMASPAETGSRMSMDEKTGRSTSVVSMEDPDVRIAAEALSGLGNPDYSRRSRAPNRQHMASQASEAREESEPLLELIAQAHPWVGGTIKTSLAAYSTTKYYSPRIVRYGAGVMERNIVSPLASGVGSVGEMTGIDGGLRRYLDSRRPGDIEHGGHEKEDTTMAEGELFRARQDSTTEQLPAYGASRPPSYREEASPASMHRTHHDMRPPHSRSWSSQLWVTTSGLSVALSHTSRQSLRFCLELLRKSAIQVQDLSKALQQILEQYESTREHYRPSRSDGATLEKGHGRATPEENERVQQLAASIKDTCDRIWKNLQFVVTSVSNYAGGALPDNAREFVRRQLMSLPQRWQILSSHQFAASETSRSGHRMIAFASEGLEMMSQVSGVLSATLHSAEQWLARVGRRDDDDEEMQDAPGRASAVVVADEKA